MVAAPEAHDCAVVSYRRALQADATCQLGGGGAVVVSAKTHRSSLRTGPTREGLVFGRSPNISGMEVEVRRQATATVALIREGADTDALESALAVLSRTISSTDGGPEAIDAFCQAFGPRHLMKLLTRPPSDLFLELADSILAVCSSGSSVGAGLSGATDFTYDCPDIEVTLCRPMEGQPAVRRLDDGFVRLKFYRASFCPKLGVCKQLLADRHTPAVSTAESPEATGRDLEIATLVLRQLSRRQTFGAEIECKVRRPHLISVYSSRGCSARRPRSQSRCPPPPSLSGLASLCPLGAVALVP